MERNRIQGKNRRMENRIGIRRRSRSISMGYSIIRMGMSIGIKDRKRRL